jgi:hypothetical protein
MQCVRRLVEDFAGSELSHGTVVQLDLVHAFEDVPDRMAARVAMRRSAAVVGG